METAALKSALHRPSVLLVGSEDILLSTRKAMLEREGFAVLIALPVDAPALIESEKPDVVVACHTLNATEALQIVQSAAKVAHPPALLKITRPDVTGGVEGFNLTVDAMDPPVNLIRSVQSLVQRNGSSDWTAGVRS